MLLDELTDWTWVREHGHEHRPRLACQFLADRIRQRPEDHVVGFNDRVLTAEELAHRSAGVAARFLDESTNRPVVLLVDRSPSSVVALLGVQWSGRCLIPLNVDDPVSWLVDIVDRIGDCTIADATGRNIRSLGHHSVIDASNLPPTWVDPVAVSGDDRALVVFTSGSSGRPKGVIRKGWQEDSSLARSMIEFRWIDRTAVFGPLHWFGGLSQVRNCLAYGCSIVVDPLEKSGEDLMAELRRQEVAQLVLTPSMTETLGAVQTTVGIPSVKAVHLLGEAVRWSSIAAARSLGVGGVDVILRYGASEILATVAHCLIGPEEPLGDGPAPLGFPRQGTVRLNPVGDADGGLREITAHRWVSDGYWGDPQLTAEKFGIDENGEPFWRSGDLVTVDDDGLLWGVGRSDDVVKIAGKLVNPSQPASALAAIPGVKRVVVLPRALDSARPQLVAHVEVEDGVDPDDLRRHMIEKLPPHLIPAIVVRHDALPLASGGKVDRRRLISEPPVPWRSRPMIAPRNWYENLVVWEARAMLQVPEISIDDDLWHLGLDSLGAIELSESLARLSKSSMTVNDFMGVSTPADIARLLHTGGLSERSHVVSLIEGDNHIDMFMVTGAGSPAQRYHYLARLLRSRANVVAFEQWGLMQRKRPDRSIVRCAERNLNSINTMSRDATHIVVGHSWGGLVAQEMAVRLRESGQDVALILLDTFRSDVRARTYRHMEAWHVPRRLTPLYLVLREMYLRMRQFRRADERILRLHRHAGRLSRVHTPRIFGGPVLLIQAQGSRAGDTWQDEPNLRIVDIRGGHNSMLYPPHVGEVAEVIREFLAQYLPEEDLAAHSTGM